MPFWKDAELEKEEDRQALAGSRGWQRVRHYKVSVLQAAQARLKQVEELADAEADAEDVQGEGAVSGAFEVEDAELKEVDAAWEIAEAEAEAARAEVEEREAQVQQGAEKLSAAKSKASHLAAVHASEGDRKSRVAKANPNLNHEKHTEKHTAKYTRKPTFPLQFGWQEEADAAVQIATQESRHNRLLLKAKQTYADSLHKRAAALRKRSDLLSTAHKTNTRQKPSTVEKLAASQAELDELNHEVSEALGECGRIRAVWKREKEELEAVLADGLHKETDKAKQNQQSGWSKMRFKLHDATVAVAEANFKVRPATRPSAVVLQVCTLTTHGVWQGRRTRRKRCREAGQ